jgi:hypothetical protein
MRAAVRFILATVASLVAWVLALPVLLFALPVWVFTVLVRAVARIREPDYLMMSDLIQYEPRIGWKPKPDLNAHYLLPRDDIYHVRTDRHGWPGTGSIDDSHVVVFGDSFAFGWGIDSAASFSCRTRGFTTKAIGAPGYQLVQELLLMQEMAPKLSDKLVVWLVFLQNDLYENLSPAPFGGYRAPFIRRRQESEAWEIVTEHVTTAPWTVQNRLKPEDTFAQLCSPSPFSDRVYSGVEYLLREGHRTCSEAGARLAVMSIPSFLQFEPEDIDRLRMLVPDASAFDVDYPDRMLGGICSDLDVPFLASKSWLDRRDYKAFERVHWTASGHEKVARLIERLYASSSAESPFILAGR